MKMLTDFIVPLYLLGMLLVGFTQISEFMDGTDVIILLSRLLFWPFVVSFFLIKLARICIQDIKRMMSE